ncbi:DEAD/DEAH box helicase [Candidatus Pacearchaeota archaeon]|nr:DEAD/DEAH box helicase [Candidatus Pacearchaeota archaeon]
MKTFEELGLNEKILGTLLNLGIKIPSEIQEKAIPLVLAGRDVIGGSATGSGKTLAFASVIIEKVQKNKGVQALVLTPTRELADQVANSIWKLSEHKDLNILPIYGGTNMGTQIREIPRTDIIVGTPGRILDHLQGGTLDLRGIKFLVLDEVDRMFDMGFQKDVEKIINVCPKKRQTMLFSATVSSEIDYLAEKHTQDAINVSVKSHIDHSQLKQVYYNVLDGLKFSLLAHLLRKEESDLVMVFCGTRRNVDFVADNLNSLGIKVKAIHGGMVQNKRNRVLKEFNSTKGVNVLVCTDVAARGLDIPGVSHVYNYDLPKTSVDYIHRIGRTARAGRDGIAINVLCSKDYENFGNILKDENLKIVEVPTPWFEKVKMNLPTKRDYRGRGNRGGNNFSRLRRNDSFRRSDGPRNNSDRKPRNNDGPRRNDSPRRENNSEKSYGNRRGRQDNPRRSDGPRRDIKKRGRNFSRGNNQRSRRR